MIAPYLFYADAPAAIAFLTSAFGFEEEMCYAMPDGRVGHAQLVLDGALVMLASGSEDFGTSPLELANVHAQIWVQVDDVDAHHARALAGGATIVQPPADQHGQRMYRALDPEGQRWIFAGRSAGA